MHHQKADSKMGRDGDNDDGQFLPENEAQEDGEEMNISPALRALMAKYIHRSHYTTIIFSLTAESTNHPNQGILMTKLNQRAPRYIMPLGPIRSSPRSFLSSGG